MIECKLLTPESCDLSLVKGFQGSVKFRPYLLREHWFKFPGVLNELLELTLRLPVYGIRFPTYWHDFKIQCECVTLLTPKWDTRECLTRHGLQDVQIDENATVFVRQPGVDREIVVLDLLRRIKACPLFGPVLSVTFTGTETTWDT